MKEKNLYTPPPKTPKPKKTTKPQNQRKNGKKTKTHFSYYVTVREDGNIFLCTSAPLYAVWIRGWKKLKCGVSHK
jgi:hypothetical protein